MKKSEILEIIKDYPDDIEIKFTDETDSNENHDMYLKCMTEDPGKSYIRLWFSRV